MARFVALYPTPDDPDGFDEHYRTTHLPLVDAWPGLQSATVTRFAATPRGTPPDHHLMFVAEFATDEEMAAALRSEAGAATAQDARLMAERFGTTPIMLLGSDF
jgi:uncharacterized protein (TIGR02118 family)